jgi:hypothetical protein
MNAKNEKPHWLFYPLWIILTSLCVPIAFFIDLIILRIIIHFVGDFIYVNGVRHITEDYLYMVTFIPLVGLITGVMQYGLLRRYLSRMGLWVLATIGGWFLGALLIATPIWLNWTDGSLNLDLAFILMGLAIGVGQWRLLRRRLPKASWWIGANVVGWGLLALITPGNALNQSALLTLGSISACVTAAMLAILMNQVRQTQPNDV